MSLSCQPVIVSKRKIAELYFRQDDTSATGLVAAVRKGYPKLEKFFGFQIPNILIKVVYSRKEINRLCRATTPAWLVGFVRNKRVYVLSPMTCRRESIHKPADIQGILLHEIVHIFVNEINQHSARWLNEGLALNLANPKRKRIEQKHWHYFVRQNFVVNTNFDWRAAVEKGGYTIAYWFVRFLLEKYGRETVIELLRIDPKRVKPRNEFKRILGIGHHQLEKEFVKSQTGFI